MPTITITGENFNVVNKVEFVSNEGPSLIDGGVFSFQAYGEILEKTNTQIKVKTPPINNESGISLQGTVALREINNNEIAHSPFIVTSGSAICGNNAKEGNEQCDGSGQAQCQSG